jgi:pyruvate ferredoxin oxidoreductase beta subunit
MVRRSKRRTDASAPEPSAVNDFIRFARTKGRFSKHFDKDGHPGEILLKARPKRLENRRASREPAEII